MDERRPETPEELVQEMLRLFMANAPSDTPVASPLPNPEGMLTSFEQWGAKYGTGMTRAVVGAAMNGTGTVPLEPLLTDLAECALALGGLTDEDIDAFLELRPPRIYTAPNGTTKWAVLTAITDHVTLARQVLAKTSRRSHRTVEPP